MTQVEQMFPLLLVCAICSHETKCINSSSFDATGSALTTFNKASDNLQPKVIALRSMQYTSGEMLYNPAAYADFKSKVKIRDEVGSNQKFCHLLCLCQLLYISASTQSMLMRLASNKSIRNLKDHWPVCKVTDNVHQIVFRDMALVHLGLCSCTPIYVVLACPQHTAQHTL